MKNPRLLFALLLVSFLFLGGCAQVPLEINRFTPYLENSDIKTIQIGDETFAELETKTGTVEAAIFEYNTILVLAITINNNGIKDIEPDNYSIRLFDGRDLKPVKQLSREDLISIRAKSFGGSSGSIQDQIINNSMTVVMSTINMSTKDKLSKLLNQGIDKYFMFRPIYAKSQRRGILCFLPNFPLEYPLTLAVSINNEHATMRFLPKK